MDRQPLAFVIAAHHNDSPNRNSDRTSYQCWTTERYFITDRYSGAKDEARNREQNPTAAKQKTFHVESLQSFVKVD